MYKKVHLRLAALCAGITAAIMIIMSFFYLYVSETGLYRNQYNLFKNDMNTITTNLEQQSVISMEWLSKMEAQGNYTLFVLDNDVPFLYNQLTSLPESEKFQLLNESLAAYNSRYIISKAPDASSPYTSFHVEFEFTSPSNQEKYFCGIATIERGSSFLKIVVLFSLNSLKQQMREQRLNFVLINILAIFLLFLFSYVFTGKLLKPILENQKRQTAFIASASHEFRTPLAVILSSAECCVDAPAEKKNKFLNNIKKEGLRMSALINDLLTLSNSDSQSFPIRKKPTELDTLLINAYESFEPLAKEKSLSLSIDLPNDTLPLCHCDPDRISQVLSIFLHNAISYTPQNGKINLSLSYKKGTFSISVKDNGIGISDEEKKKIFDRFYRAEQSRSTKGHFGLGLSIAYEIMKSHNGTIGVKDSALGGSEFFINLPCS